MDKKNGFTKGFSEHKYMLFLDRILYSATVRLQADRGLGRSFSVLLPYVTGMHELGYINDELFELYKNRYGVSLDEAANSPTVTHSIRAEIKETKYKRLNKYFGEVLAQWATLKPKTRDYHSKEAAKHKNLKNAKLLLDLAKPNPLEASQ